MRELLAELDAIEKALPTAAGGEYAALSARREALLYTCRHLTAEQKVLVARHPRRPKIDQYIGALFTDWKTLAAMKEGSVLLCILYLALFSSAYAYIVQIIVQKKLSETLSAILLSLEAVASVLFSLVFGRVGFSYPLLLGGGIMVIATVLASAAESKKDEKEEKEEKEAKE